MNKNFLKNFFNIVTIFSIFHNMYYTKDQEKTKIVFALKGGLDYARK